MTMVHPLLEYPKIKTSHSINLIRLHLYINFLNGLKAQEIVYHLYDIFDNQQANEYYKVMRTMYIQIKEVFVKFSCQIGLNGLTRLDFVK